ncbi:translocator assembly and maintenance protein 41 [Metschnikowia aff. pulcherrima]|uniref:Phosphatidate cytidylyltransferase, mitochondrial n=1 Tax=Metschnikowia aff. pulcherrima TaxID=2163413 RepID=A0A4P6XFP0_9ASCO|nr:translocator assembly and maintenance protein 41 [Metschnikowia aff. pulcherrima]
MIRICAIPFRRINLAHGRLRPDIAFHLTNQASELDSDTMSDNILTNLQRQFRSSGLQYSFGYGLGVLAQSGYEISKSRKPQLDVIHIVDKPVEFHRQNAARFPKHYSSVIRLGDSALGWIQNFGAGVYFNPYVSMSDGSGGESVVKYGIISSQRALMDLREWTTLYIAGRLQKPVKHLFHLNDALKLANEYNLECALNLSLLIILSRQGSNFISCSQLFNQVALISYMGDPRMIIGGENPNKVQNIVKKQLPFFKSLYREALEKAISKGYVVEAKGFYCATLGINSAVRLVADLPRTYKKRFLNTFKNKHGRVLEQDMVLLNFLAGKTLENYDSSSLPADLNCSYIETVLHDSLSKRALVATILGIIAYPAFAQSMKGILTAGVTKSAKYAWEKKLKSLGS